MTPRRITGVGAIVLGVLAAIWLTYSPQWTLSRMQTAASHRDAAALDGYIDYASVRANLKTQIAVSMAKAMAKDPTTKGNGALAMKMAGQMVDAFVKPETMTNMLAGGPGDTDAGKPHKRLWGDDVDVSRIDLNHFTVTDRKGQGGLSFELQGMVWRLVSIQVPAV